MDNTVSCHKKSLGLDAFLSKLVYYPCRDHMQLCATTQREHSHQNLSQKQQKMPEKIQLQKLSSAASAVQQNIVESL